MTRMEWTLPEEDVVWPVRCPMIVLVEQGAEGESHLFHTISRATVSHCLCTFAFRPRS